MIKCKACGKEDYVNGFCECSDCARLYGHNTTKLRGMITRLRRALHDAIERPMGVVPDSAEEFYGREKV